MKTIKDCIRCLFVLEFVSNVSSAGVFSGLDVKLKDVVWATRWPW